MQKQQFIELIKKRLGNTGIFRAGVIEQTIGVVWQGEIKDIFIYNMGSLDSYCKTYKDVVVSKDDNAHYSILPEHIIQTIDSSEGVRRINKMKGQGVEFAPMTGMQVDIFENLEAGKIADVIGYVVKADRIEYFNMPDDIEFVKMDLVIPFDKWEMEDEIRLPMGVSEIIVEKVIAYLKGTPYVDPRYRKINVDERELR